MTTSDDRTPDPGSIASASFTTVRRGFDPNEVRSYLQHLAADVRALADREAALRSELDELKAQPSRTGELDEATVAAWLGEEAARVLTTARDASSQVRGKAQDYADQLREEVAAEVTHLRDEAQLEVAHLRAEVDAEVARRREESLAEAEVEIETARQEGRSMVSEARAVRERMLADLARRRDGARAQLTALRGERDRIVNAIEATRDHLDRLMDDLRAASPEDDRELPPVPFDQDPRAVSTGEPRLTLVRPLHPVHQDREPAPGEASNLVEGEAPADLAVVEDGAATSETDPPSPASSTVVLGEVEVEGAVEVDADSGGETAVDMATPAESPEDVEAPATSSLTTATQPEPEPEPTPSSEPVGAQDQADDPEIAFVVDDDPLDQPVAWASDEVPAEDRDDDGVERPSVDDLFARIRAARSEAVGPVETPTAEIPVQVAEPVAPEETGGTGPAGEPVAEPLDGPVDQDRALLRARDEVLDPMRATLARQLKRALADEQNEVFDRLRRVTKLEAADEVLGSEADHAERYRASGEDAVWAAALAGAASTSPDASAPGALEAALERHRVLDEVLDEVTLEVAMPLRERLESALGRAEGEPEEATNLLRNAYREWKAQRLEELAGELVLGAYGRGAYAATPPGQPVRWVLDRSAPGCRDTEANAAVGSVPCGEVFPTGHRHPPASAGCRCLLEVTHD